MLRLILTFLFASFAFFLEAQSVFFGSTKPVLTKKLNLEEAFNSTSLSSAELEFWKISEETPQDKIDRVSIHIIERLDDKIDKEFDNEVINLKYSYDANIRYTLDSLCIVHKDLIISDTLKVVRKTYFWIGSTEMWTANYAGNDSISNTYFYRIKKGLEDPTKPFFFKKEERLQISEKLFNWIKVKFPALRIIEERKIYIMVDDLK